MRKTLLSALAVGLFLGLTSPLAAQETTKPVIVVSITAYDELLKDVEYVGQLRNQPELAKTLEGLLGFFTQGQGLNGLDKTRPWGGVVLTDGQAFPRALFLPVTDVNKLLQAMLAFVSEPKELEGGVLEVEVKANAMPLFIKPQEGWAFIAQSAEDLALVPKDPLALLGGLEKQYDVAVRAHVQNVPEIYRQLAIDAITDGLERNMQRLEDEDDATYERRKQFAKTQLDSIVTVINELDQLTVGWSIDRDGKKTFFDFGMTATAGTKTADQLARIKDFKTRLSGFTQPESALNVSAASIYTQEEAEQALQTIESMRAQLINDLEKSEEFPSNEAKAQVSSIVSEAFNLVTGMLKSGRSDIAATALGQGPYTIVGAAWLGDTSKVPALVQDVADLLKSEGRLASFDKDVARSGDVTFHRLSVKPREGEAGEHIAKVLGPGNIEVIVGTDEHTAYLGVGADALKAVQEALQKSKAAGEQPATPMRLSVSSAAIARIVAAADPNNLQAAMLADMLKESGSDKIRMNYRPVANGVVVRLEAEEGVLKLLGALGPQNPQPPGF